MLRVGRGESRGLAGEGSGPMRGEREVSEGVGTGREDGPPTPASRGGRGSAQRVRLLQCTSLHPRQLPRCPLNREQRHATASRRVSSLLRTHIFVLNLASNRFQIVNREQWMYPGNDVVLLEEMSEQSSGAEGVYVG